VVLGGMNRLRVQVRRGSITVARSRWATQQSPVR
jgi:hypothetical protein